MLEFLGHGPPDQHHQKYQGYYLPLDVHYQPSSGYTMAIHSLSLMVVVGAKLSQRKLILQLFCIKMFKLNPDHLNHLTN